MGEIAPEAFKWLRKIKNALENSGSGIPVKYIPRRILETLLKEGKIYFNLRGEATYIVQLTERKQLSPKDRKWVR